MKYRAKISNIAEEVSKLYFLTGVNYIHDDVDTYIEVDNADEAELLEEMNILAGKAICKRREWHNKYWNKYNNH